MSPTVLGFLTVLMIFALGATAAGLLLDRAARRPGAAAGILVVAVLFLSWGGVLLWGE
ncbi:hypothetical protein NON00_13570 [Roseomonas sp. GC11]|uniref:hypothetical protein n=1 Tax=Roseomonas sp. GC11 TaxID=2950546 RepID=UPI00210D731A|nr:hypothetical protein [Roseomonas sp. GC11]MCQ4160958.1 hypothetical protein [Roseomonas sp. GC11]